MRKNLTISERFAALRICADICFYFLVLEALPLVVMFKANKDVADLLKPWSSTMLFFAVSCLAVGFIAVRCESLPVRFFLSLLPGLCFIPCEHSFLLLFVLLGWLYFIIVITIGGFGVSLMKYRRRAKVMLFIAAFFSILSLALFSFRQQLLPIEERSFVGFLSTEDVCGIMFFFLCVFSLRGMRAGDSAPLSLFFADSAFLLLVPMAFFGLTAFFFFAVFPYLLKFGTFILTLLARFFASLFTKPGAPQVTPDVVLTPAPSDPIVELMLPPKAELSTEGSYESILHISPVDLSFLIYVIVGLILIVFIVLTIHFALKSRPQRGQRRAYGGYEHTVRSELREKKTRSPLRTVFQDLSRAARLRSTYREYLDHIKSHGYYRLSPFDSSQDILDGTAEHINAVENARLRELYIAARYGDPDAVAEAQVNEAKKCLETIKAEAENRVGNTQT